jgi:hypothetical protein
MGRPPGHKTTTKIRGRNRTKTRKTSPQSKTSNQTRVFPQPVQPLQAPRTTSAPPTQTSSVTGPDCNRAEKAPRKIGLQPLPASRPPFSIFPRSSPVECQHVSDAPSRRTPHTRCASIPRRTVAAPGRARARNRARLQSLP